MGETPRSRALPNFSLHSEQRENTLPISELVYDFPHPVHVFAKLIVGNESTFKKGPIPP